MFYDSQSLIENYKNENINNSNSYDDNIKINIDELVKNSVIENEINNIKLYKNDKNITNNEINTDYSMSITNIKEPEINNEINKDDSISINIKEPQIDNEDNHSEKKKTFFCIIS